jgi:hypothetical protein
VYKRQAVAPRAALAGVLVAMLAGALANDSGPFIVLIGTVYLALAVGYLQGVDGVTAKGFARRPPLGAATDGSVDC